MNYLKKTLLSAALVLSAACGTSKETPEFKAGIAEAQMPVPVGIPTTGYRRILAEGPQSPYNDLMPGTNKIHGHPTIKSIVFSKNGLETVIAKLDIIAIPPGMRSELVEIIETRTGKDLDQSLILTATHTHAGPGRITRGKFNALITDSFFPAMYKRLLDKTADVIGEAYSDLSPAELGYAEMRVRGGQTDRRCEDLEDYTNGTMPVIAIRKNNEISGLLLSYAIHSTVFRFESFTLSSDLAGAIEEQTSRILPKYAPTIFVNSWAGDMWYGDLNLEELPEATPRPKSHKILEHVGMIVANTVKNSLDRIVWDDDPVIRTKTYKYGIDREIIGYTPDEFPYENGAVYCSLPEETCSEFKHLENLDKNCIPFSSVEPASKQAIVTIGKLGEAYFLTWPGESVTRLAEEVIDTIKSEHWISNLMFLGYAQNYLGYQLSEEDWWTGGYEASGSLWGPKQGDYMSAQAVKMFDKFMKDEGMSIGGIVSDLDVAEIIPDEAINVGKIIQPPLENYNQLEEVMFKINGLDPWYGVPKAFLQKEILGSFVDVLRNGKTIDSNSMQYTVELNVNPPYTEKSNSREYVWTFKMPLSTYSWKAEEGNYRFRIQDKYTLPFEVD